MRKAVIMLPCGTQPCPPLPLPSLSLSSPSLSPHLPSSMNGSSVSKYTCLISGLSWNGSNTVPNNTLCSLKWRHISIMLLKWDWGPGRGGA